MIIAHLILLVQLHSIISTKQVNIMYQIQNLNQEYNIARTVSDKVDQMGLTLVRFVRLILLVLHHLQKQVHNR